jgi:predicted TIM-barrel fold metal-dependent hydrolase
LPRLVSIEHQDERVALPSEESGAECADTSCIRRFDVLEEALRQAGAHKLLFGSDGPWLHPGGELVKVFALNLNPAEQALVPGGNLFRLLAG